jgi:BASS family bile acid:Na+ symporter
MRVLLGNGTALAMAAVAGAGLLAGHLLGGPGLEDRAALAIASATRHPGLALLIGKTAFPTQSLAPAVLLFLLVGLLAAIPYQIWIRKREAAQGSSR